MLKARIWEEQLLHITTILYVTDVSNKIRISPTPDTYVHTFL